MRWLKVVSQKEHSMKKELYEVSKKADKYKRELRKRATPAEKHIKKYLVSIKKKYSIEGVFKFKYKFQKSYYDIKDNLFIVDFYFPTTGVSLEIDGGYHDTYKQKWRDYYKEKFIREKRHGRIVRLTNEEALEMSEEDFLNFLEKNYIFKKKRAKKIKTIRPICTDFPDAPF